MQDNQKAISIHSDYTEAYTNSGYAKLKTDDLFGALDDFNRSNAVSPIFANPYCGRGVVNLELGDFYSGCLDLEKAGDLGMKKAYEMLRDIEEEFEEE